ncbi:hypothetical protein TrLO_g12320 [Triparma laevis f. longispina]|uniref:Uncharacterized protein n=1 Tax=Triparma laevis f. longispina TaxID=1714387 RepID=A0A9W7FLL9_9STRA|nr:hypothetical protein TrLO_g12320 [Triparma laevis f. longispina]
MFPLDLPSFPYQLLFLLALLLSTTLADNTDTESPPTTMPKTSNPHSDPTQIQTMLAWATSHGAYLHPSLTFRDGGFYADRSPINPNEIVASIPTSLEYPLNNRTLDEFTSDFVSSRSDKNHFHYPYFSSLPTTCQNFACLTPDPTIFTVLGARNAKIETNSTTDPIAASIITSRKFSSGLQPIMDLFNHDQQNPTQFVKFNNATNRYELRATFFHPQNSQVYNFYLLRNPLTIYRLYGFLDTDRPLDCLTMRALRVGNPVQRVACIAYAKNVDLNMMADEIKAAVVYDDFPMIKGAAQWIDRNSNFDL